MILVQHVKISGEFILKFDHISFILWRNKYLTCKFNLKLTLIFGHVASCIVITMTWPPLGGDHSSKILEVLQISSTIRNLVLRFKWGSKE